MEAALGNPGGFFFTAVADGPCQRRVFDTTYRRRGTASPVGVLTLRPSAATEFGALEERLGECYRVNGRAGASSRRRWRPAPPKAQANLNITTPNNTSAPAAMRSLSSGSPSSATPMIAANRTLVSRIAPTIAIGAFVIAHSAIP